MSERIKFDYSKLQGLIKEKGYTASSLASKIGISNASMSNKLNGKKYFSQAEISSIVEILGIEPTAINHYFFNEVV